MANRKHPENKVGELLENDGSKADVEGHRDSHDHHDHSGHHGHGGHGGHHGMTRFHTPDELHELIGDELIQQVDAEILAKSIRHSAFRDFSDLTPADRTLKTKALWTVTGDLESQPVGLTKPGLVGATIAALRVPRVDHRTMTPAERTTFNNALQAAYASGEYQTLADIHSHGTTHRMHSMEGQLPAGTHRFLPWHRLYLLKCEHMLRSYRPSVRIPYWNYAVDHDRPDWVWAPPGVTRGQPGGTGGSLPDWSTVDSILNRKFYGTFTADLEGDAHNGVHNWCNGTITDPATASQDPIFWLLHAYVDYVWDRWQGANDGVPSLVGADAVLDPWGPLTIWDVEFTIGLGYWYKSHWNFITTPDKASWEILGA
jgi:tyrosinase